MKPEKRPIPSSEHEQVYHAAVRCQAASLSLTARRLHGLKNACSVEGKKTGGFASQRKVLLSRFGGMQMSGHLKSRAIIGLMRCKQGENDPPPNVGERTDGDAMTFSFRAFALGIRFGPGFLLGARPRELVQSIAQRFDAAQAAMGLGVGPALKQDRGGAPKRLQASSAGVAAGIIANLGEQSRGQALSCSGQARE